METFEIKSLDNWAEIEPGEIIAFETEYQRNVKLTVNATSKVRIYVSRSENMANAVLLAASQGLFKVAVATRETLYMQFQAPDDVGIFVAGTAADHRVAASEAASYTNPEPRRSNSEFDRILHFVRMNEVNRERQFKAEVERLRRETLARPVEPEPAARVQAEPEGETEAAAEGET